MSNEQQQLAEIRRRYKQGETAWYLSDIAILLDIVKGQEARLCPTGWISANVSFDNPCAVKVVFETPECASSFIDGIEPAYGPVVAAASMRSACVEKVKALQEEYDKESKSTEDYEYGASLGCAALALERAVEQLESVSIEEQKS